MTAQLQGRELDHALAYALFPGTRTGHTAFYSTDHNAMHAVEDELERRGLQEQYAEALIRVLKYPELYDTTPGDDLYPEPEIYTNFYGVFQVIHATAEQKARAALAVLMEAK